MKNTVNYLSEVLKMIEHAQNGNIEMMQKYAILMAEKMEKDGLHEQAKLIKDRVYQVPGQIVVPQ